MVNHVKLLKQHHTIKGSDVERDDQVKGSRGMENIRVLGKRELQSQRSVWCHN